MYSYHVEEILDNVIETQDIEALKKHKLILYHGSRGGLSGSIKPISRERCDFGKGFYMGTMKSQAEMLISEDDNPVIYELEFDLSQIPNDRILILKGDEWLYNILTFRHLSEEFMKLTIAQNILKKVNNYDVIIGKIADDKMREAIRSFNDNASTKEGLYACLKEVQYGYQIVAKTEEACKFIKIINEHTLSNEEIDSITQQSLKYRSEVKEIVKQSRIQHRDGKLLVDIINDFTSNEGDGSRE